MSWCLITFIQYDWNSNTEEQVRWDMEEPHQVVRYSCTLGAEDGGGGRKAEREQHSLPPLHYLLVNENSSRLPGYLKTFLRNAEPYYLF